MIPKVSILVPVYGVEKFIERCAVSLFEQTFDSIEYIFVNDCSKDNSISVLKTVIDRYPHKKSFVQIIENARNLGIGGVRGVLLDKAIGDFVLFVDSDDYVELNMVELMYNKATEDNSDIVVSDFFMEWTSSSILVKQDIGGLSKEEFLKLILSGQTMTCVWNKLFKRSLYVDNNIQFVEGVNVGEDLTVVSKLIYYASIISKIEIPLYHYIQFNEDSYTKKYTLTNIKDIETVILLLESFFLDLNFENSYGNSLLEYKLRKKLEFIIKVDYNLISYVLFLFPDSNIVSKSINLSLRDKITLRIMNTSSINITKFYSFCFNNIFKIYQSLKSR